MAKDFAAELSPSVPEEISEIQNAEEVVPESKKSDKLKITEIQNPNMKLHDSNSSSSLTFVAAIFLVAIFAGGAWYYLQNTPENVANVNPPAKIETTQPAENTAPPSATNPVSAAVVQEGVNVQAKFNGECWTRVFVDGAFAYEGVPAAGQIMDWHAVEGVTIRVGNAAGIEVSMNGQNYGVLGGIGEVVERTFTRQ